MGEDSLSGHRPADVMRKVAIELTAFLGIAGRQV
jgi:hypothetical protein